MGVPAFFRWLSKKYPSIVVHCVEEKGREVNGVKAPVDTSLPNPNDYEFDNLYLDMNGIIHPCCHPENKPAPKNEDEMMVAIFEYIDRIFSIVRPRKLLYMAIDGVAPRAKMNQQRSRRFRASKESKEKAEDIARIRSELQAKGAALPPEKEKTEHFDSNCITPGTEFMDNLSVCLRYYIADRLNNDPGWKNIKVILSDANVPGEGEHKIMDYIRKQRANPSHDPNTKHCLNGADADLIMLVQVRDMRPQIEVGVKRDGKKRLATHELHFTIIREEFKPNQKRPCEICGQIGHVMDECMGLPKEKQGEFDELSAPVGQDVEFIFIRLNVLREYLERELRMEGLPFPYSFERCLDDWVFMCFFVGNDFLPHLPSLEIREGAVDRLVGIYKRVLPRCGGYLAKHGIVDLSRVERVLKELGYVEDEIFKKRQENDLAYKRRLKENKEREKQKRQRMDAPLWTPSGQFSPHVITNTPSPIVSPRQEAYAMRQQAMSYSGGNTKPQDVANKSAAANLRAMLATPSPDAYISSAASTPNSVPESNKRKKDDDDEEPQDDIRLWEAGWKGRYYQNKFHLSENDEGYDDFRKKVADAYVEGLCWVLLYYYQGCPSWKWFYPYHYAPFASDFRDLASLPNSFERGTQPFKPLEQLMGVFPAASGNFIPPTWRELMSNPDSPIIDFYPLDFEIDLNGKKYAWQVHNLYAMSSFRKFKLPQLLRKGYPEDEISRNIQRFDCTEIPVKEIIGQGAFGDVYTTDCKGPGDAKCEKVVIKKILQFLDKEGVALLPFVDEKRLLGALSIVYPDLTEKEKRRNSRGKDRLFLRQGNPAFDFLVGLYEGGAIKEAIDIVVDLSGGMSGKVEPDDVPILPHKPVPSPIPQLYDLKDNRTISVLFTDPVYEEDQIFKAEVLPKAELPARVLKPEGYDNRQYRPVIGMNANRTSFAQLGDAGRRMLNFQRGDLFRPFTPASYVPPFRSNSGPPQHNPRHGYHDHPRSNPGTPLSSRDYNDSRRQNYGRNRALQYNTGGYQGNQSHYNSGGHQRNRPNAWSQTNPYSRGPGSSQFQYSLGDYQHSSRDPRQQQQQQYNRQQGPPARDDRRHSYPLSNYRYRPY